MLHGTPSLDGKQYLSELDYLESSQKELEKQRDLAYIESLEAEYFSFNSVLASTRDKVACAAEIAFTSIL